MNRARLYTDAERRTVVERCAPRVLVLADWTDDRRRKASRIKQFYEQIELLAEQHSLLVVHFILNRRLWESAKRPKPKVVDAPPQFRLLGIIV